MIQTGDRGKKKAPLDQVLPDTLPEFDLVEGLHRLMGNQTLLRKMIANFAIRYAGTASDICSAINTGDFERAHVLVHEITGVAGNLAAKDLHAAALTLDKCIKHVFSAQPPPAQDLNAALTRFSDTFDRTLKAASALVPATVVQSPPSEDRTERLPADLARETAQRLRQAAEIGDVSELTAICSEVSAKNGAFSSHRVRINQLVDDFDFEAIFQLADELEVMR